MWRRGGWVRRVPSLKNLLKFWDILFMSVYISIINNKKNLGFFLGRGGGVHGPNVALPLDVGELKTNKVKS